MVRVSESKTFSPVFLYQHQYIICVNLLVWHTLNSYKILLALAVVSFHFICSKFRCRTKASFAGRFSDGPHLLGHCKQLSYQLDSTYGSEFQSHDIKRVNKFFGQVRHGRSEKWPQINSNKNVPNHFDNRVATCHFQCIQEGLILISKGARFL